jgi:hypothetical protein
MNKVPSPDAVDIVVDGAAEYAPASAEMKE